MKGLNIFKLINCLSKAEKRYLSVSLKRNSKYHTIFNIIQGSKEYNKTNFLKGLKKGGFKTPEKENLSLFYQEVLYDLAKFHQNNTSQIKVRKYFNNVEILYRKNLINLAEKELRKAEKLINKYSMNIREIELLSWKRTLSSNNKTGYITSKNLKFDLEQSIGVHKKLEEIQILQTANDYLLHIISTNSHHNLSKKDKSDIKKIIAPAIHLKINPAQSSFWQLMWHYLFFTSYHYIQKDYEKYYSCNELAYKLWEKHPHIIHEYIDNYISMFTNFLNSLYLSKQYKQLLVELEKYKNIPQNNNITNYQYKSRIYNTSTLLTLAANNQLGYYNNNIENIKEIRKNIDLYPPSAIYYINIQYNLVVSYFMIGDYDKTLLNIYLLEEQIIDTIRIDIQIESSLIKIIAHKEIENDDYLPYLIRNFENQIKKSSNSAFYKKTLKIIKSICIKNETSDIKEYLENIEHNHPANSIFIKLMTKWLKSI